MKSSRLTLLLLLTILLVFGAASGVSADYSYVQNDPDIATKFSIDSKIDEGFATDDLYIGTTRAYLGAKADGATPVFTEGMGIHPADILITNGKVGIVLAIGTADPWGYPSGSILDAGRVSLPEGSSDWTEATFGKDTVLTCQLLFNNWDAWAPVNCGMVYCDLVKYNFGTKTVDEETGTWAVQISRKYTVPNAGVQRDFDVVSYYSIAADAEYAYMYDNITNKGNERIDKAITNQISISNKGGDGIDTDVVDALTAAATYNWVADDNGDPTRAFATSLITPGENLSNDGTPHPFTKVTGAVGYREFNFADIGYDPGESRTYESYLMISDECSWQDVYDFYSEYHGKDTFSVSGTVTKQDGSVAKYPVVLIYRDEEFYGWVMGDKDGKYSVTLPDEGESYKYDLRVELKDTVTSAPSEVFTSAADGSVLDISAGDNKVPVTFHFVNAETGEPTWGRVNVGTTPVAAFTGQNYFLSDNSKDGHVEIGGYGPGDKDVVKGQVTAMIAPGAYNAKVYTEGFNFYSVIKGTNSGVGEISGNTATDKKHTINVSFTNETPVNWYSIDNHHHGQRMDAFTEPETVAKAQVTAGLDVLTLDDHEFVLDNWPVYQWGRTMDIVGYMPSEEVTASWAHFDIMPLSVDCYEQHLDREQKNNVVNTNQSLEGIIQQGHEFGASIGAMHPTSNYGMLYADNNKTVPGGLIDEFDGLETQFSANHTNEAMAYWNAYLAKSSHRNVDVKRPHYIWASTDIHNSGSGTSSGSRRSYVFVDNGDAISAENFDTFGVEFARSEALGHSFNSSGVVIVPEGDVMYGETYYADEKGNFSAKFDISSINDISEIHIFSSMGKDTVSKGSFNGFKNLLYSETITGSSAFLNNYTVDLNGVEGKQWLAIGVVDAAGKQAFTNPIWVNGADVKTEEITAVKFQTEPTLPAKLVAGEELTAPTSAGILITTPWSVRMVADWTIDGVSFGTAASAGAVYTYQLSYEAPTGYFFSQKLAEKDGWSVSKDGKSLVYSVKVKTSGGMEVFEIPYAAKDGEKAEYIVAQAGDDRIARSWYDAEAKVLYVKAYENSDFVPVYVAPQSFKDTKDLWMDPAVTYLRARDVVKGVNEEYFNTYDNITRAEFITMFMRSMGLMDNGTEAKVFADAADIPAYAKEYIDMASSYGIVIGDDQNNFNPNAEIKRQDMFLIAYRALDLMGLIPESIPDKEVVFEDFADTSDYAKDAIEVLAKLGAVNGTPAGILEPQGKAIRAEGAQFLYNVLLMEQ